MHRYIIYMLYIYITYITCIYILYIYIYIIHIHANVKSIKSPIKQGFLQFSELSVKIAECPVKLRRPQEL